MDNKENINILVVNNQKGDYLLSDIVTQAGYTPIETGSIKEAIQIIEQKLPRVVLLNLKKLDTDCIEIFEELRIRNLDIPVVIITRYGSVRSAVEATKLGAHDYLTEPCSNEDILAAVRAAIKEYSLKQKLPHPCFAPKEDPSTEFIYFSDEMKRVFQQIDSVSLTDFTVVLYGETGSGKELAARIIHRKSSRCEGNFEVVDCGTIPETLIESELFGHEKGSFTGANVCKEGLFELASGGTLFLDEIGNLPLSMQGKLLRALQEKTIRRVGGKKNIKIDIRIIAASNEKLEDLVSAGRLRRDLYHRINEFSIEIPPLKRRSNDIIPLANHFLNATNKELNKAVKGFSEEAVNLLLQYHWPGNVRELKNVIRRAVLLADDLIQPQHLALTGGSNIPHPERPAPADESLEKGRPEPAEFSLKKAIKKATEEMERKIITQALQYTGGNKSKAARLLEIDYTTLHYKLKQYGLNHLDALEAKDNYSIRHTYLVADYSVKLAQELDMPGEEVEVIRNAALLHDVGKIAIPDHILMKKGPLTEAEKEIVKRHPAMSLSILEKISTLKKERPIIYYHQEHWDGSGYPEGLKGKEIPLGARILALADTYAALTTDRPYRRAFSPEEALNELRKSAGSQFDPELVEAFIKIMEEALGEE